MNRAERRKLLRRQGGRRFMWRVDVNPLMPGCCCLTLWGSGGGKFEEVFTKEQAEEMAEAMRSACNG